MKVYHRLSEFLKHPSETRRQQLNSALAEYQTMFERFNGVTNDLSGYSDMELSMNDY